MFNKSVFFWLRLYSKACAQTLYNWTLNLKIWEYNYEKCFWTHLTLSIFFSTECFIGREGQFYLTNLTYFYSNLDGLCAVSFHLITHFEENDAKKWKVFFLLLSSCLVLLVVGRDLRIRVCERTTSGTKKNLIYLFPVFEILSILGKSNTKNRLTLKSFF